MGQDISAYQPRHGSIRRLDEAHDLTRGPSAETRTLVNRLMHRTTAQAAQESEDPRLVDPVEHDSRLRSFLADTDTAMLATFDEISDRRRDATPN